MSTGQHIYSLKAFDRRYRNTRRSGNNRRAAYSDLGSGDNSDLDSGGLGDVSDLDNDRYSSGEERKRRRRERNK
jgi:hypothetical protein